ncbi:MAG: DUF2332 domain-containing protein [Thermoleophilia bacterium]
MIAGLFRSRAAQLERAGRSRLYVELMRGAADDLDARGIVASILEADPATPDSVPELRLLAALHHLVLAGGAPELARFFPSAGGGAAPGDAWPVAQRTLAENEDFIRGRVGRTLQTNEPGRCVALYGGLLWLSERHRLPIRLLEIGASAGLNLNADRFAYVVGDATLGEPSSALTFREPWVGAPVADPVAAAARLRVVERRGCDLAPIDPTTRDGRLELLSYIWPDEPDRLARVEHAAQVAAQHPAPVDRRSAAAWLALRLADASPNALTVIWQSVVNQYLDEAERGALRSVFESAGAARLAWLTLEPPGAPRATGGADSFELRCRERPEADGRGTPHVLGRAGYHGPPVVWEGARRG